MLIPNNKFSLTELNQNSLDKPNSKEVTIWKLPRSSSCHLSSILSEYLSKEEQVRAGYFKFEALKREYMIRHGLCKMLLANYLGLSPKKIQFEYNRNSKPKVKKSINDKIEFNVSHSKDWIIVAISFDAPIGVDIEYIRQNRELLQIAKSFFTRMEYELLLKLPLAERTIAFYKIWTRKEAYIKALGTGLSLSLNSFYVKSTNAESTEIYCSKTNKLLDWSCFNLELNTQNYSSTLVAKRHTSRILYNTLYFDR